MKESKYRNPLEITEDEKIAMMIYGGTTPDSGKYPIISQQSTAHGIINSIFFEGIDNELIRIIEDQKYLGAGLIQASSQLMEVITDLYSAMYKYGKTIRSEIVSRRVERTYSADKMQEKGETISYNSTTTNYYYGTKLFSKKHMTLLEFHIQPGTPCVDYYRILNSEYEFYTEGEVLVAPFCPVTVEKMKDYQGEKRLKVTVSAPDKPQPLTQEEKDDKRENTITYLDRNLRVKAERFLEKIHRLKMNEEAKSAEEAKSKLSKEEISDYLKWKQAFFTVVKYRFREIALEIEAAIEQRKFYGISDIKLLTCKDFGQINNDTVEGIEGQAVDGIDKKEGR